MPNTINIRRLKRAYVRRRAKEILGDSYLAPLVAMIMGKPVSELRQCKYHHDKLVLNAVINYLEEDKCN